MQSTRTTPTYPANVTRPVKVPTKYEQALAELKRIRGILGLACTNAKAVSDEDFMEAMIAETYAEQRVFELKAVWNGKGGAN